MDEQHRESALQLGGPDAPGCARSCSSAACWWEAGSGCCVPVAPTAPTNRLPPRAAAVRSTWRIVLVRIDRVSVGGRKLYWPGHDAGRALHPDGHGVEPGGRAGGIAGPWLRRVLRCGRLHHRDPHRRQFARVGVVYRDPQPHHLGGDADVRADGGDRRRRVRAAGAGRARRLSGRRHHGPGRDRARPGLVGFRRAVAGRRAGRAANPTPCHRFLRAERPRAAFLRDAGCGDDRGLVRLAAGELAPRPCLDGAARRRGRGAGARHQFGKGEASCLWVGRGVRRTGGVDLRHYARRDLSE